MSKVNSSTKSTRPPAGTGIDPARRPVHAHGVDESAETCVNRKMMISQSRRHPGSLPPCTAAMESCGRAHCRGREYIRMGHDARLIAPKFVRPHVMSSRNGRADAAATCESAQRPNTRLAGVRSEASRSHPALHRAAGSAVSGRVRD